MSEKINIIIAAQTNSAIKGLDQVSKSTQRVGQSVQNAQSKMGSFNNSVTAGNVNLRKFAMGGAQQAGYQIGDFAVQVANGTSKMQAFGQQAPQLLQIFGPIGAVVGAAVAIFAAFAVVAEKTSKASGNAKTAVDDLNKAFDTLKQVDFETLGKNMSKPAQMVLAEYSSVLNMIQRVAEEQRSAAIVNVIDKFAPQEDLDRAIGQVQALQNEIDALPEGVDPSETLSFEYEEAVADLRELQNLRKIMNGLDAKSREEAAKKLRIVTDTLIANELLTPELSQQLASYADQFGLVQSITDQAEAVDKAHKSALGTIDDTANKYVDILGSEKGLQSSVRATNALYEARLGTIDDTANKYIDILGSESGLQAAVDAANALFKSRLGTIDDTANNYVDVLGSTKGLAAATDALNQMFEDRNKLISKTATTVKTELSPAMTKLDQIAESVGKSFEDAMMSAVDGTSSVKSAFRSMASEIIKELYRVFVVKQITGFISGFISDPAMFGGMGGTGSIGSVRPMARPASLDGGGYTGNGARAGGLDGKGGFMAMMHPRETVVDHTKGQGGGITVIQNNTFQSGVTRSEVSALLPRMVEASKAAVLDAKRQGGSYGKGFA